MSTHVLIVSGSAHGLQSSSYGIARKITDQMDQSTVKVRDLSSGLHTINGEWVTANLTPEAVRSSAQVAALQLSTDLIDELNWAEMIIVATPIYNFGVPSVLKVWIDKICRAGKTFNYTDSGPKGLLTDKRSILVITSGGVPVDSSTDFATPYLRQVLSFIGISDVQTVSADQQLTTNDFIERADKQITRLM